MLVTPFGSVIGERSTPSVAGTRNAFGAVIVGVPPAASSSSVIAMCVPVTVRPVALPVTETVSGPSRMLSFVGVRVNLDVARIDCAGIVSVRSSTIW